MTIAAAHEGLVVRPIVEVDRAVVRRMWTALFRTQRASNDTAQVIGSATHLTNAVKAWIELVIHDDHHFGFVAVRRRARIGFVACSIRTLPWLVPDRIGTIGAMWVEPVARRQGVGRKLAETALATMAWRDVPVTELHAKVTAVEAAAFWRSLGFAEHAVQFRRASALGSAGHDRGGSKPGSVDRDAPH
jgi:ribosomal protein S18 acetylase RimI-like enzyme